METQRSSKARVKEDKIGNDVLKAIFAAYETESVETFRKTCIDVITMSAGKASTKASTIDALNKLKTKDRMVTTVTNYTLAGQGLKV